MPIIINGEVVADNDPRAIAARNQRQQQNQQAGRSHGGDRRRDATPQQQGGGGTTNGVDGITAFLQEERMIFRKGPVKTQVLAIGVAVVWMLGSLQMALLVAGVLYLGATYGNTDAFWNMIGGGGGGSGAGGGSGGNRGNGRGSNGQPGSRRR